MLSGLLDLALRHRIPVLVAVLAMAGTGVWAFKQLKLEAYPDISDTGVVVVTLYPGFAAEEVEQQVTIPIERASINTARLTSRRSRTIFGLSIVELTFAEAPTTTSRASWSSRSCGTPACPMASRRPWRLYPRASASSTGYVLVGDGYDAMQLQGAAGLGRHASGCCRSRGVADVTTSGPRPAVRDPARSPRPSTSTSSALRQVADAVKNNSRNAGGRAPDDGPRSRSPSAAPGLIRSRRRHREHRPRRAEERSGLRSRRRACAGGASPADRDLRDQSRSAGAQAASRVSCCCAAVGKRQRGAGSGSTRRSTSSAATRLPQGSGSCPSTTGPSWSRARSTRSPACLIEGFVVIVAGAPLLAGQPAARRC